MQTTIKNLKTALTAPNARVIKLFVKNELVLNALDAQEIREGFKQNNKHIVFNVEKQQSNAVKIDGSWLYFNNIEAVYRRVCNGFTAYCAVFSSANNSACLYIVAND